MAIVGLVAGLLAGGLLVTGRRVREAGREHRETAPVAADDAELPTRQPGQPLPQAAASMGVTIQLRVESSSAYYGKATFGSSDWLDATMSLVGYGHRSVPNVFLTAPLQTTDVAAGTGSWNGALQ
jgi:hypothetical protein